jgi:peptidyl-prolyl cis-trans isomerase C
MQMVKFTVVCAAVVAAGVVAGCKEPKAAECAVGCGSDHGGAVSAPVEIPGVSAAQPADPAASVVTVNGESLTRAELDKELDMITASPQFAGMPPEQAGMIRQQMTSRVVDRFVSQKLLTKAADAEKVEVTDAEVDDVITSIRGTLPEDMTLEGIMQERGIVMDKLRGDVAADIKIRKLLDAKTAAVPAVTDEQVAAYYEGNKEMFNSPASVQARHILIKLEKGADEATKTAAKEKLEGIRKQIEEGTVTFAAAATEHSDCPSSQRGGDLGTFSHGQMVPAFEEAAFKQEINAVGPVIETPFGYHIVQVTERSDAGERTLAEVSAEISEQLTMQEKQTVVQDYIESLRTAADIKYADQ